LEVKAKGRRTIPTGRLKSLRDTDQLELIREPLDTHNSDRDHEQCRQHKLETESKFNAVLSGDREDVGSNKGGDEAHNKTEGGYDEREHDCSPAGITEVGGLRPDNQTSASSLGKRPKKISTHS
jgi:hypothetical protein